MASGIGGDNLRRLKCGACKVMVGGSQGLDVTGSQIQCVGPVLLNLCFDRAPWGNRWDCGGSSAIVGLTGCMWEDNGFWGVSRVPGVFWSVTRSQDYPWSQTTRETSAVTRRGIPKGIRTECCFVATLRVLKRDL